MHFWTSKLCSVMTSSLSQGSVSVARCRVIPTSVISIMRFFFLFFSLEVNTESRLTFSFQLPEKQLWRFSLNLLFVLFALLLLLLSSDCFYFHWFCSCLLVLASICTSVIPVYFCLLLFAKMLLLSTPVCFICVSVALITFCFLYFALMLLLFTSVCFWLHWCCSYILLFAPV